jgi:hypothetical protein
MRASADAAVAVKRAADALGDAPGVRHAAHMASTVHAEVNDVLLRDARVYKAPGTRAYACISPALIRRHSSLSHGFQHDQRNLRKAVCRRHVGGCALGNSAHRFCTVQPRRCKFIGRRACSMHSKVGRRAMLCIIVSAIGHDLHKRSAQAWSTGKCDLTRANRFGHAPPDQ